MKLYFILFFVLFITSLSCKKNESSLPAPFPPVDDAKTVLLREIITQSLPNPYFHFTYDKRGYVTQINFASGRDIYRVEYENKRVKKMTNIQNNNSIVYSYTSNQVSAIDEFSGSTGKKIFHSRFFYTPASQVNEIQWFEFLTTNSGLLYKKALLSYHGDGNLASIEHYYNITGTALTLEKTDHYVSYDNKTNVDDFYLMKDFSETYLFLPQVKFQKNNPLHQVVVGKQNDYDISYTYEYQNNLPLKKTSTMTQTRGANTGQSMTITHQFKYY